MPDLGSQVNVKLGETYPLGMHLNDWAASYASSAVAKILLEEKLGHWARSRSGQRVRGDSQRVWVLHVWNIYIYMCLLLQITQKESQEKWPPVGMDGINFFHGFVSFLEAGQGEYNGEQHPRCVLCFKSCLLARSCKVLAVVQMEKSGSSQWIMLNGGGDWKGLLPGRDTHGT